MVRRSGSRTAALAALACVIACEEEAPPRPQLLVVVDTNLPTVAQASLAEDLSRAGAIDTLRIDVLKPDLTPIDSLIIVAPSPEDWPVSFGIQGGDLDRVLVQARVFRSDLATPDGDSLVPTPALTVDRIIDVVVPSEGIDVVGVTLDADCLDLSRRITNAGRISQPHLDAVKIERKLDEIARRTRFFRDNRGVALRQGIQKT